MENKTYRKIISHKQEWIFLQNIKRYEENGYYKASEPKLAADGTWQIEMRKDMTGSKYDPTKKSKWKGWIFVY